MSAARRPRWSSPPCSSCSPSPLRPRRATTRACGSAPSRRGASTSIFISVRRCSRGGWPRSSRPRRRRSTGRSARRWDGSRSSSSTRTIFRTGGLLLFLTTPSRSVRLPRRQNAASAIRLTGCAWCSSTNTRTSPISVAPAGGSTACGADSAGCRCCSRISISRNGRSRVSPRGRKARSRVRAAWWPATSGCSSIARLPQSVSSRSIV